MGFFQRLFGICQTRPPGDAGCWSAADGKIEIILDRTPELSRPGGAIRLEGPPLPQRVLVVHGRGGDFHAFPNRCTHAGHRRLDPLPGEDKIRCCSIGQSVFDYQGQRISGSARDPLEPLPVEVKDGKLVIALP
ncbi:MAG: (2Fe-2S)-binding protein [Planctomycetes bacterium RBG_13_63_9]|nr:MAG: (2Fe-2S)-binding protein [Planctomycetes bacterium RBG_13_63_9]